MNKLITFIICFLLTAFYCAAQTTPATETNNKNNVVIQNSATGTDTLYVGSKPKNVVKDTSAYSIVEEMPEYKGGIDELLKFIATNTHYPDSAKWNMIEGTVYVSFIIEGDGTSSEHKVVRGVNPWLNEEALRVCRLIQYEKGGRQSGKPVRVQFTLPLRFQLK